MTEKMWVPSTFFVRRRNKMAVASIFCHQSFGKAVSKRCQCNPSLCICAYPHIESNQSSNKFNKNSLKARHSTNVLQTCYMVLQTKMTIIICFVCQVTRVSVE